MKKSLNLIPVLLIGVTLVALLNPEFRSYIFGEELARPLTSAKEQQLVFFIDTSQSELIQEDSLPIPDFDAVPFNREESVQLGVYEDRVKQGAGLQCLYRLGALKSQRFNPKTESSLDISLECFVPQTGPLELLPPTQKSTSLIGEASVLTPLFNLLWPETPSSSINIPSEPWVRKIAFRVPHGPSSDGLPVQYKTTFTLAQKLVEQGKEVYQVTYEGLFEPQDSQSLEFQTYGFINGHLLIDATTKECIGGEYRTKAQIIIPNGELPNYIWTELTGARYVRIQQ